jgi:hypothetical protein
MMNLAGKFSPEMKAMLGVGALTAGASTLGNIVSGQAQEKGPGRVALEALGAGALGGALGRRLPLANTVVTEILDEAPLYQDPQARMLGKRAAEAGIIAAGLGAGGLGGLYGGGVANVGQLVGIPGLQQQAPMDPERPGSSNTMGARNMQPTMQYF